MPTTTRKPEDFVKVSGGLLLLYGFGTMIGPVHRRDADGLDAPRKACSSPPRSRISCSSATRCCASAAARRCRSTNARRSRRMPSERGVTPEAARLDPRTRRGARDRRWLHRNAAKRLRSLRFCRTNGHDLRRCLPGDSRSEPPPPAGGTPPRTEDRRRAGGRACRSRDRRFRSTSRCCSTPGWCNVDAEGHAARLRRQPPAASSSSTSGSISSGRHDLATP